MSWIDVENKLAGWFQLVINPTETPPEEQPQRVFLIWSGEGGVRPAEAYVMFRTSGIKNSGLPYKGSVQITEAYPNGIQYVLKNKTFTLSIDGFGKDSMDYLQALKDSFDNEDIKAYCYNNSISILDSTEIMDISFVEGDGTEKRFTFDVMMSTSVRIGEEPGYIDTISGVGTVTGFDQSGSPTEKEFIL